MVDDVKREIINLYSDDFYKIDNSGKYLVYMKLYLSDIGLLVTLMFKEREFTANDIYLKLLSDKLNVNLGIFYENVIAQILATNGHKLYYHTMYNEVRKHNYEVDFLISDGKKISPIEVKSSSYKAHKSLDIFCEKYSNRIKNRYVIYPKDLEVKDNVIYLPTYLAMFL